MNPLFRNSEKLQASNAGGLGVGPWINGPRLGAGRDQRPGANQAIPTHFDVVGKGRVYADEGAFSDLAKTRYDTMGRNKAMVANHSSVADMISTPQRHIIPYFHLVLNDVVFEDKAVLSNLGRTPDKGL